MTRKESILDDYDIDGMVRSTKRAVDRDPQLTKLYNVLSNAGGKYIYIDAMDSDYWVDALLERGSFLHPSRVTHEIEAMCQSKPMECYQNLISICSDETLRPEANVYIGYSLMVPEELWLQHVWMYDGETLYESTPVDSDQYYGMPVDYMEFVAWMEDYRWRLPRNLLWGY